MATSIVDTYHYWGAEFISHFQAALPGRGRFFMQVSAVGDPGLAFTFYFPLLLALHAGLGVRLMWTLIFCEWSNMILKWVLAGDRPFWWIHETPVYSHRLPPPMYQFPITCETGSGNPSGHAKLNAAMFYVLVSAFISMVVQRTSRLSEKQKTWARRGLWAAYASWMVLVVLSRVYVAAHFPHQCIAGVAIGIGMAIMVARMPILQVMTRKQYLALSATIITTVLGVYFGLQFAGWDALWSMEKAIKWCIRREYIHLDTMPFYSFSRFSGVALGLGMGLSSSWYKKANRPKFSWKMTASLAVLSLAVSQVGVFVHQSLPRRMVGLYPAEFVLNASVTFILVAALPHLVRVASRVPAGDKYFKNK